MDGARNFKANNGTLAGVAVALAGPKGTQAWVIFNDDPANTYDFALNGQTVKVKPGEAIAVPVQGDAATLNGTGAYRWLAFDDAAVYSEFARSVATPTGALADDSVTKAKIAADVAGDGLGQNADGSLEVKTDATTVETSGDALRVKDGGITAAKIGAKAVTGAKRALDGAAALAAAVDRVTSGVGATTTAFATKTTIPAGRLLVGSRIKLKACAVVTDGAGAVTMQATPKLGATELGTAPTALDVATNDVVMVDAEAVIREIGAAGKFCSRCDVYVGHDGIGAYKQLKSVVVDGAIDTTVDKDVTLVINWAAGAGEDVDLVSWSVEVEN